MDLVEFFKLREECPFCGEELHKEFVAKFCDPPTIFEKLAEYYILLRNNAKTDYSATYTFTQKKGDIFSNIYKRKIDITKLPQDWIVGRCLLSCCMPDHTYRLENNKDNILEEEFGFKGNVMDDYIIINQDSITIIKDNQYSGSCLYEDMTTLQIKNLMLKFKTANELKHYIDKLLLLQ